MQPILGRGFRDGDDRPGAEPVVLLELRPLARSVRQLAATSSARTIRANGVAAHRDRRDAGEVRASRSARRCGCRWSSIRSRKPRGQGPIYQVIARLKPDVSIAQAKAQARDDRGAARDANFPATNRGIGADVMPYARDDPWARRSTRCSTRCSAPASACCSSRASTCRTCWSRARRCGGARSRCAWRSAPGAAASCASTSPKCSCWPRPAARIGILLSIFGMRWFTQALSVNPPPFWITFELDYRVMLFVARPDRARQPVRRRAARRCTRRASSAGAALKDDSRSSTSARLGTIQQRARRRRAGGVVRAADCRRPDDQERRAAEERADAVRDRERADRAGRSAARDLSRLRGEHPLLRAAAAAAAGGAGRRGGDAVGWTAGRRQRLDPGADRRQGVSAGQRLSARARRHRHRRLLRDVPDEGAERPRIHAGRHRGQPAGRDRQRVVRADALSGHRPARPPDQAHPARARRSRG